LDKCPFCGQGQLISSTLCHILVDGSPVLNVLVNDSDLVVESCHGIVGLLAESSNILPMT